MEVTANLPMLSELLPENRHFGHKHSLLIKKVDEPQRLATQCGGPTTRQSIQFITHMRKTLQPSDLLLLNFFTQAQHITCQPITRQEILWRRYDYMEFGVLCPFYRHDHRVFITPRSRSRLTAIPLPIVQRMMLIPAWGQFWLSDAPRHPCTRLFFLSCHPAVPSVLLCLWFQSDKLLAFVVDHAVIDRHLIKDVVAVTVVTDDHDAVLPVFIVGVWNILFVNR